MQATTNSVDFLRGKEIYDTVKFNENKETGVKSIPKWDLRDEVTAKRVSNLIIKLHANHPNWSPEKTARKAAEIMKLRKINP